jgi:hypothetical protein
MTIGVICSFAAPALCSAAMTCAFTKQNFATGGEDWNRR